MRKNNKTFSARVIIKNIAGTIYAMSPFNSPRNMEVIMKYVIDNTLHRCIDTTEHRYICTTEEDFSKWLKNMLMSCKEFCELNLSYNEYMNGIDINDENRLKYQFTTGYDVVSEESMKDDFVDLDACIRNIFIAIMCDIEDKDCWFCDNNMTKYCDTCKLNSDFSNHYHHINTPCVPEKYKRWCYYSCPLHIAICCEDCTDYDNCKYKCTESCDTCSLKITNSNFKD